ncbi:MAG TPA: gamma-glutamyl-gamma-aminobutyrate hydrolase family protein [Cyclobacteriaceae bacterium]|nr:gamma-glutamyl-gamma-aminobutyrate hydrolase family protein [Cyclobacteriaceae bacterium]
MRGRKLLVGITDGRFYENYANWISTNNNVELVRLGYKFDNVNDVGKCQGLFMTGGEDVHPQFYGKKEYKKEFNLTDIDVRRDEFELRLLGQWQKLNIPLLGVCRGQQLVNVFFGGTLIPDLPSFGKFNHAKKSDEPRYHSIAVDPNSQLRQWLGADSGDITSVHHQSVDRVATKLTANAISPDGVVEGLEWLNPSSEVSIMLVQWHPEMMKEVDSPFSKNIREHFLTSIQH